jgi:hypothetical protein
MLNVAVTLASEEQEERATADGGGAATYKETAISRRTKYGKVHDQTLFCC